MNEILLLGALMASGFAVGSLAERIGIPRVAAYVAVGAFFAEPLAGTWLPASPGRWTDAITDAALGLIAFLIGAEIDVESLKRQARSIAGTVAGQSLGVLIVVTAAIVLATAALPGLFQIQPGWRLALVFAVLAVATAPAATIAVVEEYKAKGSLTATLIGIVAIDDVIAVALFTLAVGLAGEAALSEQAVHALREIGIALIAGAAAGAALGWFGRYLHEGDLRLPMIVAAVLLNTGLSGLIGYADLLSNIVMGYVAMRVFRGPQKEWLKPMQHVRDTIFLLFFTLAGTHFDLSVFASALPLILLYVAARTIGKYAGAWAGAALAGGDENVRRWAGLAILPQAGVAIGLALRATAEPGLERISDVLLNVIIGSTIVFELLAPWLTKLALHKAGEIRT